MSKQERRRVWRRSVLKSLRSMQTWVALAGLGVCGGIGASIGIAISPGRVIVTLCGAVGGAVGGLLFGPLLARATQSQALKELKSREKMDDAGGSK